MDRSKALGDAGIEAKITVEPPCGHGRIALDILEWPRKSRHAEDFCYQFRCEALCAGKFMEDHDGLFVR